MPPVILWALGALGAVALAKWVKREARRVNSELDAVRTPGKNGTERPVLKRDPRTGVYRPKP